MISLKLLSRPGSVPVHGGILGTVDNVSRRLGPPITTVLSGLRVADLPMRKGALLRQHISRVRCCKSPGNVGSLESVLLGDPGETAQGVDHVDVLGSVDPAL